MDVAGLVIGVLSLPGTVKSCIDLWVDISNGLRVSDDLDDFIRHINCERIIFLSFCNASGLWELVNQVENDQTPRQPVQAATDIASLTSSQRMEDMIRQNVVANIDAMHRYLLETREMLSSYNACGPPRERKVLQKKATWPMYALQTTPKLWQKMRRNGKWDKITWGATGYKESQRLLGELRQCNAGLKGLLEAVNQPQASSAMRMVEVLAASQPVAGIIIDRTPGSLTLGDINQGGLALVPLSEMSERERESSELAAATGVQAEDNLELSSRAFNLHLDETKPPPDRELATYNGHPVMVEWRYYSRQLSPAELDLLHHRIHLLILQLRQSSSIEGFRVPPCIGFFHSTTTARYGIVFKAPQKHPVRNLWECIVIDAKSRLNRTLDTRIRLAHQLVVSVFRFFSVGWLHKNIRSRSVVFLDADPARLGLPDIYLAGFGFARKDSPASTTERNPSRYQSVQSDRNWRLYCHPERFEALTIAGDADAPASKLSHMRYDAFGLGVILLEIALWRPVAKICPEGEKVDKFQAEMAERTADLLRCTMGERYAGVVRRLLRGDFGEEPVQDGDEGERRLVFLAAFEKTVVAEMEKIVSKLSD